MDTLGGFTNILTSKFVIFVAQGLSASTTYFMYQDGSPNDTAFSVGDATTDANGDFLSNVASAIPGSATYWLHSSASGSHGARVGTSVAVAWSAGGVTPVYLVSGVLAGTPGNTTAFLSWGAATPADARMFLSSYTLRRSTTGPSSGFSNVYTGSTPSFLDTGRTNGTTYWYSLLTTYVYPQATSAPTQVATSNVVTVVPSASVEVWGSIPQ